MGAASSRHARHALVLLLAACAREPDRDDHAADSAIASAAAVPVDTAPGAWLRRRERIDARDSCGRMVLAQLAALDSLRAARLPDFDAYRVPVETSRPLAQLDAEPGRASRATREFRTRLRDELATTGINVAGHHSLLGIGMTGWGRNHWLVDRRTGHATELPYKASFVASRPESRLLVLDPADSIVSEMERMADWREACLYYGSHRLAELRPAWLEVRDDGTVRLLRGTPVTNAFWRDYLGARR